MFDSKSVPFHHIVPFSTHSVHRPGWVNVTNRSMDQESVLIYLITLLLEPCLHMTAFEASKTGSDRGDETRVAVVHTIESCIQIHVRNPPASAS